MNKKMSSYIQPKKMLPVEYHSKPMEIENHGVKIKQNLRYIESSLINGTHKEQSGILQLIINDSITDAKRYSMTFTAPYVQETSKAHFLVFIQRIKKAEATLISELQELQAELIAKNGNEKRALSIVQKIIERNLFKIDVSEVLKKWQNTTSKEVQKQLIYVTKGMK